MPLSYTTQDVLLEHSQILLDNMDHQVLLVEMPDHQLKFCCQLPRHFESHVLKVILQLKLSLELLC